MRELIREQSLDSASGAPQVPAASDPSPSEQAIATENRERMLQALGELTDEHRRVIELRHQERLSWEDIGRLMDRSPDAANKLWARAIKRLSESLGVADSGLTLG
jgi:RNA polymerase sigma-70 factor (ECF subfamily)